MGTEGPYKTKLIKKLEKLFPGCVILKNDAGYMQGVPDLIVLWGPHWAMLEVKRKYNSKHEPNQDYYVDMLDKMSFSAFIYPENETEVLSALQRSFAPDRFTRIP